MHNFTPSTQLYKTSHDFTHLYTTFTQLYTTWHKCTQPINNSTHIYKTLQDFTHLYNILQKLANTLNNKSNHTQLFTTMQLYKTVTISLDKMATLFHFFKIIRNSKTIKYTTLHNFITQLYTILHNFDKIVKQLWQHNTQLFTKLETIRQNLTKRWNTSQNSCFPFWRKLYKTIQNITKHNFTILLQTWQNLTTFFLQNLKNCTIIYKSLRHFPNNFTTLTKLYNTFYKIQNKTLQLYKNFYTTAHKLNIVFHTTFTNNYIKL